jgi:hypothetical protein
MFLGTSLVWVREGDATRPLCIQETAMRPSCIRDIKVGERIYTCNCRFRPVTQIRKQATHYGSLKSENGHSLMCYYKTLLLGYDKPNGVPTELCANEMVGHYWKRNNEYYPDNFTFEKVVDWSPVYSRNGFSKDKYGTPALALCNMYGLTVEGDHSFFANDIAVSDIFEDGLIFV